MAKRKYSGKRSKIQPSVLKMFVLVPTWDGISDESSRHFLDTSQCASIVNRRFYRQGLNWALAGIKAHTPGWNGSGPAYYTRPNGELTLSKLPNTWIMSNSWQKSMRTWSKMNREALMEAPSVRPRFLDFKIYANDTHHVKGFGANLLPAGFTAGEWEASKIVVPKTDGTDGVNNFELIAVGPNFPGSGFSSLNAVSLIEGYAASRGLPNVVDPNTPDDAADASGATPENWMVAMFNEGNTQDDTVITDMITENNLAPYPFENDGVHTDTMYPNGANQAPILEIFGYAQITNTTIGGTTRFGGTNLPCGLIEIKNNTRVYDNPEFTGSPLPDKFMIFELDYIPGTHRGYMCEPMADM
ncbi:MAG: hypothetical protein [Circular genetic element sp.]|nr:MAG: hypothetical protein [Circular genetic element sp.]